MQIRCVPFADLKDHHLATWGAIQERNPALESPYFRPEFAAAVAAVRADVEVGVLEEDGAAVGFFPFQRAGRDAARPLGGRVSDYQGVIADPGTPCDPVALLRGCGLRVWDFDHLLCAQSGFSDYHHRTDLSPCLDLDEGFPAYRERLRKAGADELKQTMRKSRKLSREVGTVRLAYETGNEADFELLLKWKSDQYRRTGATDVFSFPWTVELLRRILAERRAPFAGVFSALYAGERPVALHFGMRSYGVLHWWFPTYDPELARYSPGRVLLAELAMAAESRGIRRIDLGRGMAPYKARAMSGAVEVAEGSVDLRPVARAVRTGWGQTVDWVRRSPLRGPARIPGRVLYQLKEWLAFR